MTGEQQTGGERAKKSPPPAANGRRESTQQESQRKMYRRPAASASPARLDAEEVKRRPELCHPETVAQLLGLKVLREGGGVKVLCPWHGETHPSCQLRPGKDGTLSVYCFTCGQGGNVLQLLGAVRGLDSARDFKRILQEAADLSGGAAALAPAPVRPPPPAPSPLPYPPGAAALWERCGGLGSTPTGDYLAGRGLNVAAVEDLHLARELPEQLAGPWWATHWPGQDRRLVFPVYDHTGTLRSLRGRLIRPPVDKTERKELAPKGASCKGLVFADPIARALLAGAAAAGDDLARRAAWDRRILLGEGSIDFLALATHTSEAADKAPAVLGYYSGGWSQQITDALPVEAQIIVFPHYDAGGEGELLDVLQTLGDRPVYIASLRGGGDVADRLQRGGAAAVQALIESARPPVSLAQLIARLQAREEARKAEQRARAAQRRQVRP